MADKIIFKRELSITDISEHLGRHFIDNPKDKDRKKLHEEMYKWHPENLIYIIIGKDELGSSVQRYINFDNVKIKQDFINGLMKNAFIILILRYQNEFENISETITTSPIFKLLNNISYIQNIEETLNHELDYDKLFDHIHHFTNVNVITRILTNSKKIDVNKLNKNDETFLFKKWNLITTSNQAKKLIDALLFHYYDFSIVNSGGHTILDVMILHGGNYKVIIEFIKIDEFDITANCPWLHLLFHTNPEHYKTVGYILYAILRRKDYKDFILNLLDKYTYGTSEDDIFYILNVLNLKHKGKLKEMLNMKEIIERHPYDINSKAFAYIKNILGYGFNLKV
jgi:hypothetical protein